MAENVRQWISSDGGAVGQERQTIRVGIGAHDAIIGSPVGAKTRRKQRTAQTCVGWRAVIRLRLFVTVQHMPEFSGLNQTSRNVRREEEVGNGSVTSSSTIHTHVLGLSA